MSCCPRQHAGSQLSPRIEELAPELERIISGSEPATNLVFGGDDWRTLYFTSRNHPGAVRVKIPGIPVLARRG